MTPLMYWRFWTMAAVLALTPIYWLLWKILQAVQS